MPKKTIGNLLVNEILNPFYLFQVFAILLWWWDDYVYYASAILIVSTASIVVSLWENVTNNETIRRMALYTCPISVLLPSPYGQP